MLYLLCLPEYIQLFNGYLCDTWATFCSERNEIAKDDKKENIAQRTFTSRFAFVGYCGEVIWKADMLSSAVSLH